MRKMFREKNAVNNSFRQGHKYAIPVNIKKFGDALVGFSWSLKNWCDHTFSSRCIRSMDRSYYH